MRNQIDRLRPWNLSLFLFLMLAITIPALAQKRGSVGTAVFEHPSNKMSLVVSEFAVRIAHR